ncbi:MAG TPA: acetyl-CoA carboxylase biotin carboxyl carrier protein [Pyrinomonadaceae bacterium]|jgi:acetyl-CoA carboxylase biotin carboxyl carrier protein
MSDQEATPIAQPSSDERTQQQRTNQPERGGYRDRGRRRHSQQQNQQPQQQQQSTRRSEPSLNLAELRELVELIAQYGFTDFELEREGIRVRLRRELVAQNISTSTAPSQQAQTPLPSPPPSPSPVAPVAEPRNAPVAVPQQPSVEATKATATDEDLHIITSPIVGTFYRAPSPTTEPFVRLGSHVYPDMVVCIIEAMKLMNEIQAETSGEVAKIYVENGQPVEYGQPLFGIKK